MDWGYSFVFIYLNIYYLIFLFVLQNPIPSPKYCSIEGQYCFNPLIDTQLFTICDAQLDSAKKNTNSTSLYCISDGQANQDTLNQRAKIYDAVVGGKGRNQCCRDVIGLFVANCDTITPAGITTLYNGIKRNAFYCITPKSYDTNGETDECYTMNGKEYYNLNISELLKVIFPDTATTNNTNTTTPPPPKPSALNAATAPAPPLLFVFIASMALGLKMCF